eukprot:CAMPEP_0117651620 /NCGR_PEP_ID=MMETSP0804-20121206/2191_1 /TAXON_ID=1074897 /ORGANISM="Tetraselmis astigmatica, Strain CCMP880" /LENGTH=114 /DNA_ID=CAMNT_0005457613 /DNA_START=894 /DNA_END=1238 /DNA_ORIENTATION=+
MVSSLGGSWAAASNMLCLVVATRTASFACSCLCALPSRVSMERMLANSAGMPSGSLLQLCCAGALVVPSGCPLPSFERSWMPTLRMQAAIRRGIHWSGFGAPLSDNGRGQCMHS